MEMAGFHSLPGSDGDSTDRQQDGDGSSAGWVVLPTSPLKQRWNVLILLCIVYSAVMVPVRIGFHAEAHGYVWDLEVLISLIFVADVVLTFHTSLIDAHGGWVMDRSSIASSYVRGWFWIDAPSSVPVELIALVVPQNDNLQLLRLLRALRLVRLLKLIKLQEHVDHLEEAWSVDLRFIRLVALCTKLFLVSHLQACAFFYVGQLSDDGWVAQHSDGALVDAPVHTQYQVALYWAVTTMTTVGYGDVVPLTSSERSVVLVALAMTALVFAYMLSDVSDMVFNMDRAASLVAQRLDEVKEYTRWRDLPRELAVRVQHYYAHYYEMRLPFDEQDLLQGLNPRLHEEVVRVILSQTIGKLPPMGMGMCMWHVACERCMFHVKCACARADVERDAHAHAQASSRSSFMHSTQAFTCTCTRTCTCTGKLPLFAHALDPSFQRVVFPYIKPLDYRRDEIIFSRGAISRPLARLHAAHCHAYGLVCTVQGWCTMQGWCTVQGSLTACARACARAVHLAAGEPSREVHFLLSGEIDVLADNGQSVVRRLSPETTTLYDFTTGERLTQASTCTCHMPHAACHMHISHETCT